MRQILEQVTVSAPPSIAIAAIERFLHSRKNTLDLILPLKELGLPTELGIAREVQAEFLPNRRNKLMLGRKHENIELEWHALGGGPYPTFKGWITVRPLGTRTELELKGGYEPPLGAVGAAFDAVAGNRIAHAAAKTLLAQLGRELEREFDEFKTTIEMM